jgi:phosphoglycerol transferase MdoB-like AlkP superfamily enzyme
MSKIDWKKVKAGTPLVISVLRLLVFPALGIIILQCLSSYNQRFDNSVYFNANWFTSIGVRFLWNYLLLLIPYLILYALPFFKITSILMHTIVLLFGLAEHYTILYRNTIIFPWDLSNLSLVAKVSGNYGFTATKEVWLAIILFAVMVALSFLGEERKIRIWTRVLMIFIVSVLTIIYMNVFVMNKQTQLRSNIRFYYTLVNYNTDNGVLLNFCYHFQFLYHKPPDGYSAKKAESILTLYDDATNSIAPQGEQPDVIMIMNEAFADLRNISDFETNYPVLEYWDSLSGDNVIKKNLVTSEFGGNTANAEFEVLMSMNMKFFSAGMYPFKQFIRQKTESMASILQDNGYRTVAIHPFDKTGWNRQTVLPLIGFDQFIGEEEFDNVKEYRDFVSDFAAYDYLIDVYEEHKLTDPETPLFEYLISIQNHGGYKQMATFSVYVQTETETIYPEANQYLSLLRVSDLALKELITYFEGIAHPTVIIFYGDHLPGISDGFIDELKSAEDTSNPESAMSRYETKLLVWANYDISDSDLAKINETYISNNYVSTYVSDIIGIQRTPFQQFMLSLHDTIPAISKYYLTDSSGHVYYAGDPDIPSDIASSLYEYEILQYYMLHDLKE